MLCADDTEIAGNVLHKMVAFNVGAIGISSTEHGSKGQIIGDVSRSDLKVSRLPAMWSLCM